MVFVRLFRRFRVWLNVLPDGERDIVVGLIVAAIVGLTGTVWWFGTRPFSASPLPVTTVHDDRPWLFITSETIDQAAGNILLTIRNNGATPAYDVRVESWGEVSSIDTPRLLTPEEAKDFEERLKFFQKEYDTRTGVPPNYGGRSGNMRVAMVMPNEQINVIAHDDAPELIEHLTVKQPRHGRLRGEILYTNQAKTLKPDFQFCYEISRGRLFRCPDQDLNQSK